MVKCIQQHGLRPPRSTMAAAIQWPLRGSRISTSHFTQWKFALACLARQCFPTPRIHFTAHSTISRKEKGKNEVTVGEACWVYEQFRYVFFVPINKRRTYRASGPRRRIYPPITTLHQECMRASCPEMRAGEWLYLCVAHGSDGPMEVRTCISIKMCIIKGPTSYS